MEAYSIALYVASLVLFVNGGAELIGGQIKENGKKLGCKKHATALIKIIFGIVLLIIAVVLITFSN